MDNGANNHEGLSGPNDSGSTNSAAAGFAILALETAINTALRLDDTLAKAFDELEGKALGLYCTEPKIAAVIFLGSRCHVMQSVARDDSAITASLVGDSQAWLEFAGAEDKAAALINSELQLRGDSALFQKVAQLVESIDIDWGSLAAERFGSVPTHLGTSLLTAFRELGLDGKNKLVEHAQSYLQSDASNVVNSEESSALYRTLRDLELSIERLEARVKKLGA